MSSQSICKYFVLEEISRGLTPTNQEIAENISAKEMAESFLSLVIDLRQNRCSLE